MSSMTLNKTKEALHTLMLELGKEPLNHQKKSREILRGTYIRLGMAAGIAILTIIASSILRNPANADNYAAIYRYVAVLLSGAFSFLPFIVAEVLLYAGILTLCVCLGMVIYRMLTRGSKLARAGRFGSNVALILSVMWFFFVVMYGFSYHCTSLNEKLGLETEPSSVEELYATTNWLMENAVGLSTRLPRDVNGSVIFGSFDQIASTISEGYNNLGKDYSVYRSTYAKVKRVYSWRAMSSYGITGIFIPFTAEACVNPDNTIPALPFTMAHEMAHRLMIAPEDEANFSAFLSCTANSDRRVQYSGYFMAYRFCINALYAASPDKALEIMKKATPELNHDLEELNALIDKYDDTPAAKIGNAVNDTYLKANSQDSGVKSYGEVVDCLIAWYCGTVAPTTEE